MKTLTVDSRNSVAQLHALLGSDEARVVVRLVQEDGGVLLFVLLASDLRDLSEMDGTVEEALHRFSWSDSPTTPEQEAFDPGAAALQPGDRLNRVLWCMGEQEFSMAEPPDDDEQPQPADPFEAYPGIRAPETATVGAPFLVEVWLSETPVSGVEGPDGETRVSVPLPAGQESFDLEVQLVARGFSAQAPGWRRTLTVSRSQPDAEIARFTLIPQAQPEPEREASIQVHFSYKGNPCGYFWRVVRILSAEVAQPQREIAATVHPAEAIAPAAGAEPAPVIQILPAEAAADLTVRISKADSDHGTGLLTWTFESPHRITLPDEPPETDLGENPEAFAKAIVDQVQQSPKGQSVANLLRGVGRDLADKVPAAFWGLMDEVRAQVTGRAASVLILTEEAHVPWELVMVEPPWDPGRPEFLGAQASVSRWILAASRPALPPRSEVEVEAVTVLAGDYASHSGYRPLPNALEEAAFLERELKAAAYKAIEADISVVLGGHHQTQLLHFACHGEADPRQPEYNRIILADKVYLSPFHIRGSQIRKIKPFVFLNACQVGQAGESLGEYAGFAAAFLKEGCPGFLGPLWAVDDQIARQVAEEFYTEVFKSSTPGGRTVGEVMRQLRCRFLQLSEQGGRPAATYLAYVFYGHPNLRLVNKRRA